MGRRIFCKSYGWGSVALSFETRDMWRGLFWDLPKKGYTAPQGLDFYLCLVPCFPLKIELREPSMEFLALFEALSLKWFEAERWTDWARVPWGPIKYVLLSILSRWGCPAICVRCLWSGTYQKTVRSYVGFGDPEDGDCEPVDECPVCGMEL